MPPQLLFDLAQIDLNRIEVDVPGIEAVNPHRHPMRMLDGIVFQQPDIGRGVAFKDVHADEFWVPGHIPGRPLFPGVLMIEAAAQLASYMTQRYRLDKPGFLGFVGADAFKFRGQVVPGDRLLILVQEVEFRRGRRFVCATQGLVRGELVFEGTVTGMVI